mgnify:CR=1 FL=1
MKVGQVTRLHEYLERSAARVPDKVALICDGQRLTWRQIAESAAALGSALARRRVGRGDRVVICLENSVESAVAVFGALAADAIFSVINPQTKPDKLRYVIGDSGASCLIVDAAAWNECRASLWPAPDLAAVLVVTAGPEQTVARDGVPADVRVERYSDAVSEAASPLADSSISIDLASLPP